MPKLKVNHHIALAVCLAAMLVMVKCGGGSSGATAAGDTTRPTHGTAIKFSNITYNAFTFSWGESTDNVTASANLVYKVVKADSYDKLNIVSRANAIAGGDIISDWSSYVPSITLNSLTSETVYWVNVIVKDEAGNMEVYAAANVRTLANQAPDPGTDISFTGTDEDSTTVNWGAAFDNVFSRDQLYYRVVRSADYTKIDTLDEANGTDAEVIEVMAWTHDIDYNKESWSCFSSALLDGKRYYFAVLVKNPEDKIALYTPQGVTTIDITPPTVGSTISFPLTTAHSVKLSWLEATDNLSLQQNLKYKVLQHDTDLGADPAVWNVHGDAVTVMDWTADVDNATASGLIDNTTYFFTVLVKDEAGKMSLYTPDSKTTLDGTAPDTTGRLIHFSDITAGSIDVIWDQANDGVTPQANLLYRLVRYTDDAPMTAEEAETTTNVNNLVVDWSMFATIFPGGTDPYTVSGLDDGVQYNFWVFVKDVVSGQPGNVAHYELASATTLDTTVPTLPTDHALAFTEVKSTSAKVGWNKSTDNLTPQENLEYKVVWSATDLGTNPATWNAVVGDGVNNDVAMDWTKDVNSATATALTVDTKYYFAVIVRDAALNLSLYTVGNTTTRKSWELVGTEGVVQIPADDDNVSLAIYSDNPYIAYQDAGNGNKATVRKFGGATWDLVGSAGFSADTASRITLKFLGSTPYISFRDGSAGKATVMKFNGSAWEVVGSSGLSAGEVYDTSLNYYGTDPYVAYWNFKGSVNPTADEKATMRKLNGTTWEDVLTPSFSSGTAYYITIPAIKLESVNVCSDISTCAYQDSVVPYVVYQDSKLVDMGGGNYQLVTKAVMMKVVHDNLVDFAWEWDIAPNSDNFTSGNASLITTAVDRNGDIHAAYMDGASSNKVTVKKYSSGAWSTVGGSAGFTPGSVNSLALSMYNVSDPSVPTIAFGDANASGKASVMEYTTRNTVTAWYNVGDAGFTPSSIHNVSVAINSTGKQYVAYTYTSSGNRKISVREYK